MKVKDIKDSFMRAGQRVRNFYHYRRNRKLYHAVYTKFQRVNELADGYALCYPQSKGWVSKLTEFATGFRQRYPSINADLIFEPNQGPIWLQIRGPEGTELTFRYSFGSQVGRFRNFKTRLKVSDGFSYKSSALSINICSFGKKFIQFLS